VNIASRVADAAEAGQLLITEATRHAAAECPAQLRGLGSVQFRNISSPVSVYAACADDGIESLGYRRRPTAVGHRALHPQPIAAQA
jgi:class 3 adenylate cyclase